MSTRALVVTAMRSRGSNGFGTAATAVRTWIEAGGRARSPGARAGRPSYLPRVRRSRGVAMLLCPKRRLARRPLVSALAQAWLFTNNMMLTFRLNGPPFLDFSQERLA